MAMLAKFDMYHLSGGNKHLYFVNPMNTWMVELVELVELSFLNHFRFEELGNILWLGKVDHGILAPVKILVMGTTGVWKHDFHRGKMGTSIWWKSKQIWCQWTIPYLDKTCTVDELFFEFLDFRLTTSFNYKRTQHWWFNHQRIRTTLVLGCFKCFF